tara:strand:+ start:18 stop:2132 length:2115 start_codon:yes stop_codon:yes gene_type:complete
MALNYADIGMRVLPSYAGDVLADQIRPDRPGAETPGVDTPLPGKGKAGSFTQFATTPFQETEVDLAVDYDVSGDGDGDGPAGTAYPVKGATPFELNITAINTAQVDPAAYSPASASSFKEWLTSKVDQRLGTNYTFNPITGGYRPTGPGGAIGLALPAPLGVFAQLGAAASQRSLENIAAKAYAGEEGYAVAYVNGRVVGVGPSPFGGYVLSGQLPANLSPQQRQSIVRQLLDIPSESAAGAYRPEGMTAAESIAGAGKPSDDDTTPLPADAPAPDYSYTSYEPSDDSGPSGNQYSISDPVDTSPAEDYSYTSYEPSGGGGSSSPSGGGSFSDTGGFGPGGFRAKGGHIDMADGGSADPVQGNGFVEGSPDNYSDSQTVADDEFRRVRPGSFVMNAPMTEKLQEAGLLPKGVDNSAKKSTIKANEGGMIDVALSKGEYVFEPEEAEEIGYDVLNKLNDQGKAEVDRRQALQGGGEPQPAGTDLSRIPPLAAGLRPKIKRDTKPEGFISTQPAMQDTGIPPLLINGINVEQVGRALSLVETRGYEDRNDGYFYTRSDTKSNPSSAFGPLQITGDTLAAMLKESDELRIQMNEDINPGFANYLERYATDARNRTNFRAFGLIYEGERGKKAKGRAPTAAEKEMYKGLGAGSISLEDHKKYYPLLANIYLRYKAGMSDSEEDMVRRHFGNDKSTQKYRDAKIELGID